MCGGVLQSWLCDVERLMRLTLKNLLRACRIDLKKHLAKRDKWIKEWPGQVRSSRARRGHLGPGEAV